MSGSILSVRFVRTFCGLLALTGVACETSGFAQSPNSSRTKSTPPSSNSRSSASEPASKSQAPEKKSTARRTRDSSIVAAQGIEEGEHSNVDAWAELPPQDYEAVLARSCDVPKAAQLVAPNMMGGFLGTRRTATATVSIPVPHTFNDLFITNGGTATDGDPNGPLPHVPQGYAGFVRVGPVPEPFLIGQPDANTNTIAVGDVFTLSTAQPYTNADMTQQINNDFLFIQNGTATVTSVFDTGSGIDARANAYFESLGQSSLQVLLPSATVVGHQKISDNNSPLPRDRVFFGYSWFKNAVLANGTNNINRFTPGFEKTLFDGWTSVEVRTPFATTLNTDIFTDGVIGTDNVVLGDLNINVKQLLMSSEKLAVSGGLGITAPTSPNVNVLLPNGTKLISVRNNSAHLMPFLGAVYTPFDRFFTQGFAQVDFDTVGHSVDVLSAGQMQRVGRLPDNTFLYADVSVGYWVYQNASSSGWLQGIAPTAELHTAQTIDRDNAVYLGSFSVANSGFSDINGVAGVTVLFGNNSTLTAGYGAPLTNSAHREWDGEVRVNLNMYFGTGRWTAPTY